MRLIVIQAITCGDLDFLLFGNIIDDIQIKSLLFNFQIFVMLNTIVIL